MIGKRIGIIGRGHVGSALARGLTQAGHDVRAVGNEGTKIRETALWAEIAILAVPFTAIDSVLKEVGDAFDGKTLVDPTNALTTDRQWAIGFTSSGAEELQKKVPQARIAKAFNTVFAQHMDNGHLDGHQLTTFIAASDVNAKNETLDLAQAIGFDAIYAGPLANARLLEPLGHLNIQLGHALKMGTECGFKYLHDLKSK